MRSLYTIASLDKSLVPRQLVEILAPSHQLLRLAALDDITRLHQMYELIVNDVPDM